MEKIVEPEITLLPFLPSLKVPSCFLPDPRHQRTASLMLRQAFGKNEFPSLSWNSGSKPIISPALLIPFKCLVFFASSLKHHSNLKLSFLDQRWSLRRIVLRMILASSINSSRSVIWYCPERLVEVRCADFWHCVWSKARVNSKDLKQMSLLFRKISLFT